MIGNAVRITGGGATSGYYYITAVASSTSITVHTTPGAVTNGTGKVGGGAATPARLLNISNAAGDKVVPGNIVYIRGSGSFTPSTNDYTTTGFTQLAVGDQTSGQIQVIGENGMPRLGSNGLMWYQATEVLFKNLYLVASSNSNGNLGILNFNAGGAVIGCVVDMAGQGGLKGILGISNGVVSGCEIKGGASGASSGADGVSPGSYGATVFGNYIHDVGGVALSLSGFMHRAHQNIISGSWGDSVSLSLASATYGCEFFNNTIDAGHGHGINFASQAAVATWSAYNNIISNHAGASKFGMIVTSGVTATSDRMKKLIDYNNFYGNTSNYSNISAGPNDLALDPQYVNQPGRDFRLSGSNMKANGYPGLFLNAGSNQAYVDRGALQSQASGGSGGILHQPNFNGGYE
jgi:hypothetical protein